MELNKQWEIAASLDEWDEVLEQIRESILDEYGAKGLNNYLLALEEYVANIVMHGTDGCDNPRIEVNLTMGEVPEVEFVDNCPEFNPLLAGTPDTSPEGLRSRIGGLGIHIIRQYSDATDYIYDGKCNHLTLRMKGENRQ